MSLLFFACVIERKRERERERETGHLPSTTDLRISERQRDHVLHRNPRISKYFAISGAEPDLDIKWSLALTLGQMTALME